MNSAPAYAVVISWPTFGPHDEIIGRKTYVEGYYGTKAGCIVAIRRLDRNGVRDHDEQDVYACRANDPWRSRVEVFEPKDLPTPPWLENDGDDIPF